MIESMLSKEAWEYTLNRVTKQRAEDAKFRARFDVEVDKVLESPIGQDRLEGMLFGILNLADMVIRGGGDLEVVLRSYSAALIYTLDKLGFNPYGSSAPAQPVAGSRPDIRPCPDPPFEGDIPRQDEINKVVEKMLRQAAAEE